MRTLHSAVENHAAQQVLLVEDDVEIRALLHEILSLSGRTVRTVEDGQQALDLLLCGFLPQLMVIDLMLPKVSGWDLLRYIEDDPALRLIPRLIITGVPRQHVRAVADAIIVKPFEPNDVLAKVNRLLPLAPSVSF
jgi:CheY-like chemotaxis protein